MVSAFLQFRNPLKYGGPWGNQSTHKSESTKTKKCCKYHHTYNKGKHIQQATCNKANLYTGSHTGLIKTLCGKATFNIIFIIWTQMTFFLLLQSFPNLYAQLFSVIWYAIICWHSWDACCRQIKSPAYFCTPFYKTAVKTVGDNAELLPIFYHRL